MRRLTPKELEIGMIIAEPVKTPLGQLLAEKDTEVTRQLINRMKLYRVEYAMVEGTDPDTPEAKTHAAASKTHSQKVAASNEFKDFQLKYFQSIDELKKVFNAAYKDSADIDTTELLASVSDLFTCRKTIIELFDMLFNMRILTDPLYSHCLNVGLISRMIGRWLKLGREELNLLTLAGLLHDIGKIKIPDEVLNKPGKLTDSEFALIQRHPIFGYDILKKQPLDPRIKKAALMHHERCDGSGYPSKLTDKFIDDYAMIVGIADVYDAMTAARSYRAPLCPFQVLSNFEEDGYQKYKTKYIFKTYRICISEQSCNPKRWSCMQHCNAEPT